MQKVRDSGRVGETRRAGFAGELTAVVSTFEIEPNDCPVENCADGYLLDGNNRPVNECECMPGRRLAALEPWKAAETKRLVQSLLPRYDLRKTEKKAWYHKIPQGSFWLYGRSQEGKTHAIGWALARQIRETTVPFRWVRVKAPALAQAFDYMKNTDDPWGDKARSLIDEIDKAEAINLEEVDKFGNFTEARWVQFFNLVDDALEKGKIVRVSSQYPIEYIVKGLVSAVKKEADAKERDGVAPSETRFYELMQGAEINVDAPIEKT